MIEEIKKQIVESSKLKESMLGEAEVIEEIADMIVECYNRGNKVLVCGNGGSAADAQHIAGELVGRFKKERRGLPCIALTTDTSVITAWTNDYDYNTLFQRQVEALGEEEDILIGISTSGNSSNVIKAVEQAKEEKMKTASFLGGDGGELKGRTEKELIIESEDTPRIQEGHQLAYHIICDLVEKKLFAGGGE